MKKCAIIIVNYNGGEYLKNCLDSIKKNTLYKNYKVIVVDNNSNDGSNKLVKENLIINKKNEGFSKGNNIGIKYALKKYNPDYFYLLNNDTIVKKNWLTEAIKTIEKYPLAGIVGSKQLNFDGEETIYSGWIKMFRVKYHYGKETEVNWVSGAGMLIKKEVMEKIGLLDEIYSPAYYEETDFEKRAMINGFKIFNCPTSIILHKGGATASKLNFDEIFYRNRIIYFLKYYNLFYFLPRVIIDLLRGIKNKNLKIVLSGYKKGLKIHYVTTK
jgi:GT2 family glycosyltransferase